MKKRLLACVLAAVSAAGLCACSSGAPTISERTVVITVYAAGYGTDWLDEAIKEYQKTDPDVKFYPSGDPLAFETVKNKPLRSYSLPKNGVLFVIIVIKKRNLLVPVNCPLNCVHIVYK